MGGQVLLLMPDPVTPVEPPQPASWKRDKRGKDFTSRGDGTNYPLYRVGEETPEQARERYTKQKSEGKKGDKKPQRKTKVPPKQEAPKSLDLKALEHELAEMLKAPAVGAALYGDEYLCDHFTRTGPHLARNLVVASENNPWLRKKLEELASGETFLMNIMTMVPLVSGALMYAVPPVIYLLNLPVPETTRARFGIPERKATNAHPDATPPPIFPDITPALEAQIDRIARDIPDFHFGRFDVRYATLASLRRGEDFTIIEINGVGAEATHIWDPATPLLRIWGDQLAHYGAAWRIAAAMRARGAHTSGLLAMARDWRTQLRLMASYPLND